MYRLDVYLTTKENSNANITRVCLCTWRRDERKKERKKRSEAIVFRKINAVHQAIDIALENRASRVQQGEIRDGAISPLSIQFIPMGKVSEKEER